MGTSAHSVKCFPGLAIRLAKRHANGNAWAISGILAEYRIGTWAAIHPQFR